MDDTTVISETVAARAIGGHAELASFAERALGQSDLRRLVGDGLRLLASTLAADRVGLVRAGPDADRLAWWLTHEDSHRELAGTAPALAESDLVTAALTTGQPVPVTDAATAGGRGALLVPVHTRDHGSCVLGVLTDRPRDFEDWEIGFAGGVATILAGAVNVRLTEDALRWRSGLDQLLTDVATTLINLPDGDLHAALKEGLGRVGGFLGADRGLVTLATGDGLGQPVASWSGTEHPAEPVGLPEGAPIVRLPMRATGQLVGHVFLVLGSGLRPWPGELTTALHPLADLFAQAIAYQRQALELAESESRYRSLVQEVRDVIVRVDAAGRISYVNQAWTELTGLSEAETLQRDCFESIHPDDRALAAEHIASVMRGEDNAARSVRFIAKDGDCRWLEVKGRARFDADGTFLGLSGVLHDVTDRKMAEDKIQAALTEAVRAREEAERASAAKTEFLSRMSHELRTPLNAILGFTQLLGYADLDGEADDSLRLITQAGQHLLRLINDVLDISRMETGNLTVTREAVVVADVWNECLELLVSDAAARHLHVAPVRPADSEVLVLADRRRLTQVIVNLLSNAIKYNRNGGSITMTCRQLEPGEAPDRSLERRWARISVADTGIGMPASRLNEVFVPFNRVGAELTEVEGTGIGLTLARSLVQAMGGHIGLTSVEGAGTTFFVDLPVPPAGS